MIKFLFYLFLIYVVYRLLFGRVIGGSVKTKVFHNDTHHHYHQNTQSEPEGRITVNPKVKAKEAGGKGNIGEYVDYEELK